MIVPFGVAWLVLAVLNRAGKEVGRTGADQLVILLSAVPGMILAGLAFLTHEPAAQHPPAHDLTEVGKTFLQFISLGLGPASGWFWRMTAPGLLASWGSRGVDPAARGDCPARGATRDSGLLLFLGATTSLAMAIAIGRAGSGAEAGLEARYVTLAVPPLCSLYMASAASVRRVLGRLIQMSLFLIACVLVWPNYETGIKQTQEKSEILAGLERDVEAGAPLSLVIRGYGATIHPSQDYLAEATPTP